MASLMWVNLSWISRLMDPKGTMGIVLAMEILWLNLPMEFLNLATWLMAYRTMFLGIQRHHTSTLTKPLHGSMLTAPCSRTHNIHSMSNNWRWWLRLLKIPDYNKMQQSLPKQYEKLTLKALCKNTLDKKSGMILSAHVSEYIIILMPSLQGTMKLPEHCVHAAVQDDCWLYIWRYNASL